MNIFPGILRVKQKSNMTNVEKKIDERKIRERKIINNNLV